MAPLQRIAMISLLLWVSKALTNPLHTPSLTHPFDHLLIPSNPNLASLNTSTLISPQSIYCYEPLRGRLHTTLDGCRPSLNEIRTFPRYHKKQDFVRERWPKEPHRPPYLVHNEGSDCSIKIDTSDAREAEIFSFEQARQLATDILEECASTGVGGATPIGRAVGWYVQVIGAV